MAKLGLLFPDPLATVQILQILRPFCEEERKMILATVIANRSWPITTMSGVKQQPHFVEVPDGMGIPSDAYLLPHDPICSSCLLPLAHVAGPGPGEPGLVCQTPGCDLHDVEMAGGAA